MKKTIQILTPLVLALVAGMVAPTLVGQDFPFFAKDQSSGTDDGYTFPTLQTIGYRWVSVDAGTNNTAVTTWTDRIQGFRLLSSSNSPSATSDGVTFYRTNGLWLESQLPANFLNSIGSNNWSFLIVCSVSSFLSERQKILEPTVAETARGFFHVWWSGQWQVNAADLGAVETGKTVEWYFMNTYETNSPIVWKNGAFINNYGSTSNMWACVGRSYVSNSNYGFIGSIKELVVWTNCSHNTSNYAGLIHQYVTNRYTGF